MRQKENIKSYGKIAAMLLLTPGSAVLLMQLAYGAMPWEMTMGALTANTICVGAAFYLLWAVTGYPAACCLAVHVLCGIWGAVNHFVSIYRGSPVLPWDLTALGTAAAVSGSYDFTPTWQMAVGLLWVAILVWFLRQNLKQGSIWPDHKTAPVRIFCLLLGLLCLIPVMQPERMEGMGVKTDVWDQSGAYRRGGALAVFMRNTEFMKVDEPDGVSAEQLTHILEGVPTESTSAAAAEQPNIVAIMNESWADYEDYGTLNLTESVTDYISTLDNAIWGHAYASVFGAGTSASEFEFLTGNSMAFLPSGSIPYQQYILQKAPSVAALLKREGYRTIAFHPGERTSWQRNQAYPLLGFDQFKCGEDMNVPQTMEHGYVSDQSDFEQIIWEFEHKQPGQPMFLFNVTIQNHGSYTVKDYPAQVQLADMPGQYPMAEQYLTLANKTDEAFHLLVDYFSQREEPTIVLMFGDHQPALEQAFLDKAYGVTQDQMTMEQYMDKYRVPFVIWANYPLDRKGPTETSLNFLGQYLLDYAGIARDRYGDFLRAVQKQLPAMTFVGYQDAQGKAYSHMETTEYTKWIQDYQRLQYDRIFGNGPMAFKEE